MKQRGLFLLFMFLIPLLIQSTPSHPEDHLRLLFYFQPPTHLPFSSLDHLSPIEGTAAREHAKRFKRFLIIFEGLYFTLFEHDSTVRKVVCGALEEQNKIFNF